MNQKHQSLHLGAIRMSPLMYGSLRYIATRHTNSALNITEISELRQTQLRSFKIRGWITETADHRGIVATPEGKKALRSFEDNDEFFRLASRMTFTSLLDLQVPGLDESPRRVLPAAEKRGRKLRAA